MRGKPNAAKIAMMTIMTKVGKTAIVLMDFLLLKYKYYVKTISFQIFAVLVTSTNQLSYNFQN